MKRGILFCGFRHSHIFSLYRRANRCDRVEILACVEPDEAARAEAEATLGAVFSQESYETLLADPRVDVVAIGCAYGHRGEAVIRALEAGKHSALHCGDKGTAYGNTCGAAGYRLYDGRKQQAVDEVYRTLPQTCHA